MNHDQIIVKLNDKISMKKSLLKSIDTNLPPFSQRKTHRGISPGGNFTMTSLSRDRTRSPKAHASAERKKIFAQVSPRRRHNMQKHYYNSYGAFVLSKLLCKAAIDSLSYANIVSEDDLVPRSNSMDNNFDNQQQGFPLSFRDRLFGKELEDYEDDYENLMHQESEAGLHNKWNRTDDTREFEGYETFSQQDTASPQKNKRTRINESLYRGTSSSPKKSMRLADAYSSKESRARNYSSADMKAALKLQQQFRNHIRKTNSPGWNSNSPKKNRDLAERIQRLFDTIHANSQRLDKLGSSNALVKSKLEEGGRQKDTGSLLKDIIGSYDSTLKEMHDINRDFASLVNSIKNGGISDFDRSVLSGKIYNDVAPGDIQNSAQQIAFLESKILRLFNELKMETESRKNLERELIEANQKIEMLKQKHEHETKSYENLMKMLYTKSRDYENKISYLTQKPVGKDAYGKNLPNNQRVGEVVKDLARSKEMEKQILKLLAEKQDDYIAREDALKIANELRISNYHLKQDLTDIEEDNVRLQEIIESLKRKIQGLQKEIKGNYEAELRKMLGARKNNSKTLEQLNQELYKKLRKTKGEKETVAAEFEKNKEKVLKLEELIGSKEKEYESLKSNLEAIKAVDSARSQEGEREQLKQEVKAAIIRDLEENLAKEFEDWKNDYERQISGYKAKEQEYDAMLNEYNKIIEKLRGEVEDMRVKSQQAGSPPKSSHRILNESIESGSVFDKKAYEAALAQAFKERILNPIKSTLKHAKRHLKKKDFESPHFPGHETEKKDS